MPVQTAGEGAIQSGQAIGDGNGDNEETYKLKAQLDKRERYIERMKVEHNEEVFALRDKIKKMMTRESESAEQVRRLKEEVSRLFNDLRFEKKENRKLLNEVRERSGYCKYLEKCLLKEEKGKEERVLMEKVKETMLEWKTHD